MAEYFDFSNVFLAKNESELLKYYSMNDHAIKLEKGKQLLFGPIYSLWLVELETLKIYIKTNLVNSFIWSSKSPARAFILFAWKPDKNLCLYVDYQGLNNIIIKNCYPLLLICKLLDQLRRVKQFTQLDLTNAYHWMKSHKGDEWKTVFRTWYAHFKYQVMFFGLFNALATF